MNDYNDGRANNAAMSAKMAEAMRYDHQSVIGGQLASAGNLSGPRPAMATLGSILEQMQKLISMSNELAVRIAGPVNEANEASATLANDPMSNLASATIAIERAAHRAEQSLARALNHL
jgi:hypothetical protein